MTHQIQIVHSTAFAGFYGYFAYRVTYARFAHVGYVEATGSMVAIAFGLFLGSCLFGWAMTPNNRPQAYIGWHASLHSRAVLFALVCLLSGWLVNLVAKHTFGFSDLVSGVLGFLGVIGFLVLLNQTGPEGPDDAPLPTPPWRAPFDALQAASTIGRRLDR